MTKVLKATIVVLIFALCGVSAHAQETRGRVQGTVTDPSHAAIPGAKVTLTNTNTGIARSTTTGATGGYIFNLVSPGTYSVSVDASGFKRWIHTNVLVQTLADVSVDPVMAVGAVTQTVQVTAQVHAMEYHTTSMTTTINGTMLKDLPVISRNPTTLALLNPNIVNEYWDIAHRNPFFSAAGNGMDFGGGTQGRNEVLLDGVSTVVNFRTGYTPTMDSVNEVVVDQNAVDAQFGSTAGGIISMTTKSGTNNFHGEGYYFGRNPSLNAVSNSVSRTPNQDRYNILGYNLGGPIKKDKMFFFGSYEWWHSQFPSSLFQTLPTPSERNGDFSQSYNQYGNLRTIYDPWSTTIDPNTGVVTRTPFANNIIPASRQDPSSVVFMKDVWQPNNPGDNPYTHVNNFKLTFPWWSHYGNWSGRWDWDPNSQWRFSYRYSQFREWESNNNYSGTNSPAFPDQDGGLTAVINSAANATWTINPTTVLDMRYGISTYQINYGSPWAGLAGGLAGYSRFWPNNPWYSPYMSQLQNGYYYPYLSIGSYSAGFAGMWYCKTRKEDWAATLMKHAGRHDMKFGWSLWHQWEHANLPTPFNFSFSAAGTANTFESPNTSVSGDPFATFLLGALQGSSSFSPVMNTSVNEWAGFFQDNFRVNSRLTLNLGLRDEYDGGFTEGDNRLGGYVNLGAPIPYMQANKPVMPSAVTQYGLTPIYNGMWQFPTASQPKIFTTPRLSLQPRLGFAFRVNNTNVLRVGYGRYAAAFLNVVGTNWDIPQYGYSVSSSVLPFLQGVPQATLANPFPSNNPLLLPIGDSLGGYTNIGNSASWFVQNGAKPPINDRISADYQFMLPSNIRMDATYFVNFEHNYQPPSSFAGAFQSRNLNMVNPQLSYTYKGALAQQVANPFYLYGTPQNFPGSLRNQPEVSVASLLEPYPQYGSLTQLMEPGFSEHYQSFQIKAERPFSRGVTFMMAYAYIHESYQQYFNDPAAYADSPTWLDSNNPRHRITAGGVWYVPVGQGRKYLSSAHGVVNAILGGWNSSSILYWHSGDFLRFGQMIANGNPVVPQPTVQRWFNTSAFQAPSAYTPRTNPYQYPGLTGPRWWEVDSNLSKSFQVTERFRVDFGIQAYNLLNNFAPSDPDTNVYSSTFGMSTNQANTGRECEYDLKIIF